MLIAEERETHWVMERSLQLAASPERLREIERAEKADGPVDWFVQRAVGATSGYLYKPVIERLQNYPIPEIRLPDGTGEFMLDIGCNWGRWCVAAARKGYRPIGLDPCILSVRAASRVARQLGVVAHFVVGDARHLPFRDETFGIVFSFGVLQHLAKEDVLMALKHAARVLAANGRCVIQMANKFGVRSLYWQAKRRFREPVRFEVRYWSPGELRSRFEESIGPSQLAVDCYFGLGIQPADVRMLPFHYRSIVAASEFFRAAANIVPGLLMLADSLYVTSKKSLGSSSTVCCPPSTASTESGAVP
jgi:SAM-dependent methyltransferase